MKEITDLRKLKLGTKVCIVYKSEDQGIKKRHIISGKVFNYSISTGSADGGSFYEGRVENIGILIDKNYYYGIDSIKHSTSSRVTLYLLFPHNNKYYTINKLCITNNETGVLEEKQFDIHIYKITKKTDFRDIRRIEAL